MLCFYFPFLNMKKIEYSLYIILEGQYKQCCMLMLLLMQFLNHNYDYIFDFGLTFVRNPRFC